MHEQFQEIVEEFFNEAWAYHSLYEKSVQLFEVGEKLERYELNGSRSHADILQKARYEIERRSGLKAHAQLQVEVALSTSVSSVDRQGPQDNAGEMCLDIV